MLAVIGGTGLSQMNGFEPAGQERVATPFCREKIEIDLLQRNGCKLAFLLRHGKKHENPPHKINYQANIWALHKLGVDKIIAVNAVGGIHENLGPGCLAVPIQIIDYTHGRVATYFEENPQNVMHIDFTYPFTETLRSALLDSANIMNMKSSSDRLVIDGGVYGCTQGPRLETTAEVNRYKIEGCDLLGMTAMPEAVLARELGIDYALLALSVNWAAGQFEGEILMEDISEVVERSAEFLIGILQILVEKYDDQ